MSPRRAGQIFDIVLLVLLVIVLAVGIYLVTKDGESPVVVNARAHGKALTASAEHYVSAHQANVTAYLYDELSRDYQAWNGMAKRRLSALKTYSDGSAKVPIIPKDPGKRYEAELLTVVPRRANQFGRVMVYLHFAVNGVRPVAELDSTPLKAIKDGLGALLTNEYNKVSGVASNELVGQAWSPAAGDPPNLEFTLKRINQTLQGIDRERAKMGEQLFAKDGKNHESARVALLNLVEYELAQGKVAGAENATKTIGDLRTKLENVNKKIDALAGRWPEMNRVSERDAEDGKKEVVDLDIAVTEVEIEVTQVLSELAQGLATVSRVKAQHQFTQGAEKLLLGEPNPEPGAPRIGGLAAMGGQAPTDVSAAVDALMPYDKRFGKSTLTSDAALDALINQKVGNIAAVSVRLMAVGATQHAIGADLELVQLRKQLVRDLAELEPARENLLSLVSDYNKKKLPVLSADEIKARVPGLTVTDDGGYKLSLDQVNKTLSEVETKLTEAQNKQTEIRNTLKSLYERADSKDAEQRAKTEALAAAAKDIEEESSRILEEMNKPGTDIAKIDFKRLLGDIRTPGDTGLFGVFDTKLKEAQDQYKLTYPAWMESYLQFIEEEYRRKGDEELPPRPAPPTEFNLDAPEKELRQAVILRSYKASDIMAINTELAGYDAAKANKLASLDTTLRNMILAHANAETLDKLLNAMGVDEKKKVTDELDLFGIEKLIALEEAKLTRDAFIAPGIWKRPTKDDRIAAAEKMVYPEVPVLEARVAELKRIQAELERLVGEQETAAEAAKSSINPALDKLKNVAEKAAETSVKLLKAEAAVARKYDEAVLRYSPAAVVAADKIPADRLGNWYKTLAYTERGNTLLVASAFFLQQQRRLALVSEAFARIEAVSLDGTPAVELPEAAAKHLKSIRAVLAYAPSGPEAKPELLSAVSLLDFDAAAPAGPANTKDEDRQPLPAARLMGFGDDNAGQMSLVMEAIDALVKARSTFVEEQKPSFPELKLSPKSAEKITEFIRVDGKFATVVDWPLDVSLGAACAMAHRLVGDKTLADWPGRLKEGSAAMAGLGSGLTSYRVAAEAYLGKGLTNNLAVARPEFRSAMTRGLDRGDPNFAGGKPEVVGPVILKRIGFTDAVNDFTNGPKPMTK